MYDARMTVVTLGELLAARDESLSVRRTRAAWLSQAWQRVREANYAAITTRVVAVALTLAGFTSKHGLVLGALAAFVVAAASIAPVAAWIVAGVSLLFLEVRRR